MKLLITGGLGFIGYHSIEAFGDRGWDITVIDNGSSNTIDCSNELLKRYNCRLIEENITDVDPSFDKFDLILHLASPVGPVGVLKHSGNMGRIILDDTYWVLDVAKWSECPLLFVSTSEIYGYRDQKTYLREDGDKILRGDFTVRNEYAIAKLLSEIVITNYAKVNPSFRYQIIRPFNVTGAWQRPDGGFVLPRFVLQAIKNEPITVYYSGLQIRAFTWVKDIVDGIILINDKGSPNQEWNIGNPNNERTILYLAEQVKEKLGSGSEIVHVDPTELHGPLFSEAPEKIPDSEKIMKLGWKPKKGVDEVIDEVVEFYRCV